MGHAYYANYLYWFEQARGAWCRERGFTYKSIEAMGYLMPVVEAHLEYKGEVSYDDTIVVSIWLAESSRAAIKFAYEIRVDGKDRIATIGHTWHVFMSPETRRAIGIPKEVRALLERNPDEYATLA